MSEFKRILPFFSVFLLCSCFNGAEKGGYCEHTNTYLSFYSMVEDEKSFLKKDELLTEEGRAFISSDFSQKTFMFDLNADSSFSEFYRIEGICYCKIKNHAVFHSSSENCPYLLNRIIRSTYENADCKVTITYKKRQSDINEDTFSDLEWKNDGKKYWDYGKNTFLESENYTLYNKRNEPLICLEFDLNKFTESYKDYFFSEVIKNMSFDKIIDFD